MLARSHHVFYEGLRNNRTKENTCSPSGKGLPKGQIPHAYPLMLSTWHRGAVVQRKAHLRNSQLCWQFFAGNGVRWGFWYVFKTFRGAGQRMWHFSKSFKSQLTLDLNIDSVPLLQWGSYTISNGWLKNQGNTAKALFAPFPPGRILPNHPVWHCCRATLPSILSTVLPCR